MKWQQQLRNTLNRKKHTAHMDMNLQKRQHTSIDKAIARVGNVSV